MGLFHFLIVLQGLIAAGLVAVILMQRSEGGGLGVGGGGSPGGLMSARGAADFMTRTTTVLATLFVVLSISLAVVASNRGGTGDTLDKGFSRDEPAVVGSDPAETAGEGEGAEAAPADEAAKGDANAADAAAGEETAPSGVPVTR